MKPLRQLARLTVVLIVILPGCRLTREPLRYRDDFFKPMTVLPKRNHPVPALTETIQVQRQLEPAAKRGMNVRDSIASLRRMSDSVMISKNSHADTVIGPGSKAILKESGNATLQLGAANLQGENKKSSPRLTEMRTQIFASTANITPTPVSASTLNEYAEGLSFFKLQEYGDALNTFNRMLKKGIEEDIADNCEYWIGECHFARQEYADAVIHFQKVLSIESSNKKIDGYFMLGKTYEQTGDVKKAISAYKELNGRYPDNVHAQMVKYRLKVLKRARNTDH